jgi:hypothetical protein
MTPVTGEEHRHRRTRRCSGLATLAAERQSLGPNGQVVPVTLHTVVAIIGEGTTLCVTHDPCTEPFPAGSQVVQLFEDPTRACNTRTFVACAGAVPVVSVELYWLSDGYSARTLGLLAVEATGVLFLGCGRLVASVHLGSRRILAEHMVDLFWNLSYLNRSVLVRTELACFMFYPTGHLVGEVPIDPPWEEVLDSDGITFLSPVYGRRRLSWVS